MRFIVVGAGRTGLAVAAKANHSERITLVDRDPARVERARAKFPRVQVIEGDATYELVLAEAGAHEADALVCTTPDDPTNLMVCALAKRMGITNVVSRVNDPDAEPLFAEVGATPVKNPTGLAAEHLYHTFESPVVRTFMPVGSEAEVVTLMLNAKSPLAGVAVRDALFPRGALLIAINRAGRVLVPTGETVLQPGDLLTLVAPSRRLDVLVQRLAGRPAGKLARRVLDLFR